METWRAYLAQVARERLLRATRRPGRAWMPQVIGFDPRPRALCARKHGYGEVMSVNGGHRVCATFWSCWLVVAVAWVEATHQRKQLQKTMQASLGMGCHGASGGIFEFTRKQLVRAAPPPPLSVSKELAPHHRRPTTCTLPLCGFLHTDPHTHTCPHPVWPCLRASGARARCTSGDNVFAGDTGEASGEREGPPTGSMKPDMLARPCATLCATQTWLSNFHIKTFQLFVCGGETWRPVCALRCWL
jgi:hypothetical protein